MVNPSRSTLPPGARLISPRLELGAWHSSDADPLRELRARSPDVDALFPGPASLLDDVLSHWRADLGHRDRNVELAARYRPGSGAVDEPAGVGSAGEAAGFAGLEPTGGVDPVGGASLHRRLGEPGFALRVWIDPVLRRRGLGTELAGAALRLAFEHLGAPTVRCVPPGPAEPGARRWAAKLGFWSAPSEALRIDAFDFPKCLGAAVPLEILDDRGHPVPSAKTPLDL